MSEMTERVRAALRGFDAAQLLGTGCVNPSGKNYEIARARAIIEAMREPTAAMEAARYEGPSILTPMMIEAAAQEICEAGITPYPCNPADVRIAAQQILEAALRQADLWRAMIDEALK